MPDVVVIGGGAAGMMAAAACGRGVSVTLLEKNEKLGKKLYLTGKGRCNLTNACGKKELLDAIQRNPKFLYSSFSRFDNRQTMDFFKNAGLALKVERGSRVFPVSDHSSDVIRALERTLKGNRVGIRLHTEAAGIRTDGKKVRGVVLKDQSVLRADYVVVATGGLAYPSTGSTGDGYAFAAAGGHHVTECFPSLVPLLTREEYVRELMGLSLKNVKVSFYRDKKCLYSELGEMMFTHFGVTGPVVLSASALLNDQIKSGGCRMEIDFKPALDEDKLDKRILRDWSACLNRQYRNSLKNLLPSKLIPVVVRLSGIAEDKKVNGITKEERRRLVRLLKAFPLTVTGLRGYDEAVITRGGVSVREVDPATMESKIISGLYFAGEVLDVDALTGGYNLQIAWSTGHLAGESIRRRIIRSNQPSFQLG